ncbi:MAG: hypothetical protein WDO73_27945 [Ignavibacteriota bacterium]
MIDRSLAAHNRGKFVLDLQSAGNQGGNDWLRNAATLLPAARVTLDEGAQMLYDQEGRHRLRVPGDRTTRIGSGAGWAFGGCLAPSRPSSYPPTCGR